MMNWWIGLEASMGSIRRIMEYTQAYHHEHGIEESIQEQGQSSQIQFKGLTIFHG